MGILDFFRKKPKPRYPASFGLVDWTQVSQELGLKGKRNKIILWYKRNKFGNLEIKKYRYSEERVHTLQTIHKIPIFDKTLQEGRYPVFARILPGETSFITRAMSSWLVSIST